MNLRNLHWAILLAAAGCNTSSDLEPVTTQDIVAGGCDYAQVFGNATHTGRPCSRGPVGMTVAAQFVIDPDAQAENDAMGFYALHPTQPLVSGNTLILGAKEGFGGDLEDRQETYHVEALAWSPSATAPNRTLVPTWTAKTSWRPVDSLASAWTNGYVQQFQPAISGASLYVPESSGRVARRNLATGALISMINPLAGTAFDGDVRVTTAGAPSVDATGSVLYTVTAWPLDNSNSSQPRESWLVKVTGSTSIIVPWTAIATAAVGVPGGNDLCYWPFGTGGTPPATSSKSEPPLFKCGSQRPALNAAPAIRDNGNIVVFSRANNAEGSSWLIELDASLHPVRASSTKGHMLHGCGVRLPLTGKCAVITDGGTTHIGFNPNTNKPMDFLGQDLIDSSPAIAPNGDVTIASYTGGFTFGGNLDARGSSIMFDRGGNFRAVNDEFAWEATPSVWLRPDGTYSWLQDRQLYSLLDLGVASYSPTFVLENVGTVPVDESAVAIDFLDAGPAFDTDGSRYGVNGNGHFYKWNAAGVLVDAVALTNADGTVRSMEGLSSYVARAGNGDLVVVYAGNAYWIRGTGVNAAMTAERRAEVTAVTTAQLVGFHAKTERAARTVAPQPTALQQPTPSKPVDGLRTPRFCPDGDTECGGAGPGGGVDTPESAIEEQAFGMGASTVEKPGCLSKPGSDGEYQCSANFDIPFAGRYGFVCIVKCTRDSSTWKESCEVKSCEPPVQGGVRE